MTEIPTATTYTLNELYTDEEVPLHFTDKKLADIVKGFEIPLAPINEEAPKREKQQIGELADIVKGFEIPLAPIKEEALKIEKPQSRELADIVKGFEIPLAPIKEEPPTIEKPQIGLPAIKRAYKKRPTFQTYDVT